MALTNLVHTEQLFLDQEVGMNIQEAVDAGFLTATTITAADTVAGLIAAVNAAVVHSDEAPKRARIVQAITIGKTDGHLTDALVLNLTTVAGLLALTEVTTNNRNLIAE